MNKGTVSRPRVRCRLVAQEFAKGEVRDALFAGTPPLFAVKLLFSDCVTNVDKRDPKCIMCVDVAAGFLYGETKFGIYIELPARNPKSKSKKFVGKLKKAMYGTRDAPQVWYEEAKKLLTGFGFVAELFESLFVLSPRKRYSYSGTCGRLFVYRYSGTSKFGER